MGFTNHEIAKSANFKTENKEDSLYINFFILRVLANIMVNDLLISFQDLMRHSQMVYIIQISSWTWLQLPNG